MYKVIDVAKMLGVSKVTIYKKISAKKKEIKPYIKKVKNITYLTDEAVEIIKENLAVVPIASGRMINEEIESLHNKIDTLMNEKEEVEKALVSQMNGENEELEGMLRSLQSQINIKMSHLERKNQIVDNFKKIVTINKERIKVLEKMLNNQNLV